MPSIDLIDHSPHQPSPAEPLAIANNLVLIDNYDSFTWNVYQYLVLEGATVTVFRNDEITLEDLTSKHPTAALRCEKIRSRIFSGWVLDFEDFLDVLPFTPFTPFVLA